MRCFGPGKRPRERIWNCVLGLLLLLLAGGAVAAEPLPVAFFHAPNCRGCREAAAAVRRAEQRFGARIQVEWIDTADLRTGAAAVARLFATQASHGLVHQPSESLYLFAGQGVLVGEAIAAEAESLLARELDRPQPPPGSRVATDGPGQRLTWGLVAMAALADGVNPCAFATIVLFLSLLAAARRSRGDLVLAGLSFTLAVACTYFLLGLAIFEGLRALGGFRACSDLVYLLAFGLCLTGGLVCLWDASLAWRGRLPTTMLMKVPTGLRLRLHDRLRRTARTPAIAGAAVGAGVVVSLLESVCTGQIYLPLIAGLVQQSTTRSEGLILLAFYCLLFVLPLLVLFGLVLASLGQARLVAWGQRHWGLTKLLLAIAFLLLAGWMMPHLMWPRW